MQTFGFGVNVSFLQQKENLPKKKQILFLILHCKGFIEIKLQYLANHWSWSVDFECFCLSTIWYELQAKEWPIVNQPTEVLIYQLGSGEGIRTLLTQKGTSLGKEVTVSPALVYKKKYIYIQWGKKVFSQPPIVQGLPLKKMREACNFHHRYTLTMRDKIRKKI